MTNLPTLTIYFGQSEGDNQFSLKVVLSDTEVPVTCSLTPPFDLAYAPLVLRALNARQYPDYPGHERLFKPGDDRTQLVATLRALGLWSDTIDAVAADIHVRVGQMFGRALLADTSVEGYFNKLYDAAIQSGGGEIVLCFDPSVTALATLPWEMTYKGLQPLLLTKGVVLNCTRVILFPHLLPSSRPIGERLRILTIAPRVQMDEAARTFEELARIRMRDALNGLAVEIEPLFLVTVEALSKRLERGPAVDVLDYYGHGTFTDEGGALVLDNGLGGRDQVTASRLAALPNLPPLIVLHACQSAQLDMNDPLTGIAVALSAAGVRAVMAMQLTTRMAATTNAIVPIFYQKLAEGKSVQKAIAIIRQMLYVAESDGASWYLPALYLRQPGNEPLVLRARSVHYPPNPFAGEGAFVDPTRFIGREEQVQRMWDRLDAGGNLSIVGPPGCGKSTMLALIAVELRKRMETRPRAIWLPLQPKMKPIAVELTLAHWLGGPKVKATDLTMLLEEQHLILLLDDLGLLDKGERGLEVRLLLRRLSQDRTRSVVQLVATSLRPLHEIFRKDVSDDYSPLHNVMGDIIELREFTSDEGLRFIAKALEGTPLQLEYFKDLVVKPMVPRALREACRIRYDMLCQDKRSQKNQ